MHFPRIERPVLHYLNYFSGLFSSPRLKHPSNVDSTCKIALDCHTVHQLAYALSLAEFQHSSLLCTDSKRWFVFDRQHSAPTHPRERNAQDNTQNCVLFCHHRLDPCASTALQSICSPISSPSVVWLVHPHFFAICLLQTLAFSIFYCSSDCHHRCTCLQTSSFIARLIFSTLDLQLH